MVCGAANGFPFLYVVPVWVRNERTKAQHAHPIAGIYLTQSVHWQGVRIKCEINKKQA